MIIAKQLVRGLLCEDPASRYTVKRAMNSRWIRGNIMELEKAYNTRVGWAFA
jgi:hypothetical protein